MGNAAAEQVSCILTITRIYTLIGKSQQMAESIRVADGLRAHLCRGPGIEGGGSGNTSLGWPD